MFDPHGTEKRIGASKESLFRYGQRIVRSGTGAGESAPRRDVKVVITATYDNPAGSIRMQIDSRQRTVRVSLMRTIEMALDKESDRAAERDRRGEARFRSRRKTRVVVT